MYILQCCTGKSADFVLTRTQAVKRTCGLGTWRPPGWAWSGASTPPADDRVRRLQMHNGMLS